jgi:hypothetical protein
LKPALRTMTAQVREVPDPSLWDRQSVVRVLGRGWMAAYVAGDNNRGLERVLL